MNENHPAYESFHLWATENGLYRLNIDLSLFKACWYEAYKAGAHDEYDGEYDIVKDKRTEAVTHLYRCGHARRSR